MKRTLALSLICKNEIHNLPALFESINGCFDKVYITDTGSSDGTVEWLENMGARYAGCDVEIFHFQWRDDFAAARNHNLPHIKEDWWMWLDSDDELINREGFLKWKKAVMPLYDYHSAPYDYSFDEQGNVACSFGRERCFETKRGYRFQDFIHEGVMPFPDSKCTMTPLWRVKHRRTDQEAKAKLTRNMSILEERKSSLSPRLEFYLGKEYFDNDRLDESVALLKKVIRYPENALDIGDRTMAHQFLCHGLLRQGLFQEAIQHTLAALYMDGNRAEFFCFLGDAHAALNRPTQAIPFYEAARNCSMPPLGFTKVFSAPICYFEHPTLRLGQIALSQGEVERAENELKKLPKNAEAKKLLEHAEFMKKMSDTSKAIQNDDIVITCLPSPYPWDEEVYKVKGVGGSETAAVEMAKNLARITNRKVVIFNERETPLHMEHGEQGVYYRPNREAAEYFIKWKPKVHIAWRHNMKITDAPTYLWCHDLVTPGAERHENYHKIICLSEFHKNYVQGMQGIPEEKIWVSRNGINPVRFFKEMPKREYGKVIWPNSPDRGLVHAIEIMDLVRKEIPSATFDIFYGMENLAKYGLGDLAEKLKTMIAERPWIKYHGNVQQDELTRAFAMSSVWLYCATFIETFCISALEAACSGTWTVARKIGALENTLSEVARQGMCDLVDVNPETLEGKQAYAKLVIEAIMEEKHNRVKFSPKQFSWLGVAEEWKEYMGL